MSPKARFTALLLWPLVLTLSGHMPAAAAPTSLTVKWTATGDDGTLGTATRYDLRFTTRVLNATTFTAARAATGLPVPHAPGTLETYTLTGLAADSTYFIAIESVDDAGNRSPISNVLIRPSGILAVEVDSTRDSFTQPWPNPATRWVKLSLNLSRAADAQASVYDISGRHIRTLARGWHSAGAVPLSWDLADEQGRRVSPGAYVIQAGALGRQWTRRVVVVD